MKTVILALVALTALAGAAGAETRLFAGNGNACVIDDGALSCWGDNEVSELANGNTSDSATPVGIAFSAPVTAATAGSHMCAMSAGAVWCWGSNTYGQVGTGTVGAPVTTPTRVSGLSAPVEIASGNSHECARLSDGSVWCWGLNVLGQLGDGTTTNRSVPVRALAGGATQLALGDGSRSCALMQDTTVQCWGDPLGGASVPSLKPTPVAGLGSGVTTLRAGIGQTCVLIGGQAKCWGWNADGQLGDGTEVSASSPVSVGGSLHFQDMALGGFHSCGLVNGGLYCWGGGTSGQLGNGASGWSLVPAPVVGMASGVDEIAAGKQFTCARSGASISCWGDNTYLSLGHNSYQGTNDLLPFPVATRSVCTASGCAVAPGGQTLFAGESNACVLDAGKLLCWGDNYWHELLDGTTADQYRPTPVDGFPPLVDRVALGTGAICALAQGDMWCRGYASEGQLGNGAAQEASVYPAVKIGGLHPVDVSLGNRHGCALLGDSSVWCWGLNTSGEVGDGTLIERPAPVRVIASGAKQLAISGTRSCALMQDGSVKCWGSSSGAVFTPSTDYTPLPTTVPGLDAFASDLVTGAGGHSCVMARGLAKPITASRILTSALHTNALVKPAPGCWGYNAYGQLGTGDVSSIQNPARIPALAQMTELALGTLHSCGVSNGGVFCWGYNNEGEMGDGQPGNRSLPTPVPSLSAGVLELRAGGAYTCARTASAVECWGDNTGLQLGHNANLGINDGLPFPVDGLSVCLPRTCAAVGASCGIFADGCGGTIDCGTCTGTANACFTTTLLASTGAAGAEDGTTQFTNALQFQVPAQIPVTQGAAGAGSLTLAFSDGSAPLVTCEYAGTSSNAYAFSSCDSGAHAGDLLSATNFRVHIVSGGAGPTTVLWALEAQPCGCIATTCSALGASCGVLTDGCGGVVSCGECSGTQTCGGNASTPLSCGCAPKSCLDLGADCGSASDGCGGTLTCGTCAAPQTCGASGAANRCICVPKTCAAVGATCGLVDDGCGGTLSCGSCAGSQTCGGGGQANNCGCKPTTCAALDRQCGSDSDGCGGTLDCGSCSAPASCVGSAGRCVLTGIFTNASDPDLTGAALDVPVGAASPSQMFHVYPGALAEDTAVNTPQGPGVTAGRSVRFQADNYVGQFNFAASAPCAQLSVPYDRHFIERYPGSTAADLHAYQVNDGGILEDIGTAQFNSTEDHNITFCAPYLSEYVVTLRSTCTLTIATPAQDLVSSGEGARYDTKFLTLEATKLPAPVLFTPPPSLNMSDGAVTNAVGEAWYVMLYGRGGLTHECMYSQQSYDILDPVTRLSCSTITYELGDGQTNFSVDGVPAGAPFNLGSTNLPLSADTFIIRLFVAEAAVATDVVASFDVDSHPRVCAGNGSGCGIFADGCGGTIDCGGCGFPETCGGGGVANVCGCSETTPGCKTEHCGTDQMVYSPCSTPTCANGHLGAPILAAEGASCSDGDVCNGLERCFGGECVGGVALPVDDGDPCTVDVCYGTSGVQHLRSQQCANSTCFIPLSGPREKTLDQMSNAFAPIANGEICRLFNNNCPVVSP